MSDLTLTNTIYIRTTAAQLWQALTDPDITGKYTSGARVQSSWRPGDAIIYLAPDGATRLIEGTLLAVEPGQRLAFECRLLFNIALAGDRPHRETFAIEEMGEICKLTATFDRYAPDSPAYRVAAQGMPRTGSALKSLLETGEALVFPQ